MVENIFRHLAERAIAEAVRRGPTPEGFRQVATIFQAVERGDAGDLLLGHHHHRGLPAAVHPVGRRGPHLRPDGEDLRLRPVGGLLATFTVTPGAGRAAAAGEGAARPRRGSCAALRRLYGRVRDVVLARRRAHAGRRRARRLLAVLAGSSLGLEFLPKLEEGNIWIRAAMPASISLEEGNDYANRMRRLIKSFPEVETVISQHGRPGRRHRLRPASSTPSSSCR